MRFQVLGKRGVWEGHRGRKGFGFGMKDRRIGPGNCSIGRLMSDPRFTEAVLKFLSSTGVGKIKKGVIVRGEAVG